MLYDRNIVNMVHVRGYWRFRLGNWEYVRKHLRHYPKR